MEKRERNIIKVAVVGPESTGKTTLCEQLATYYNTIYVPEFAREYLNSISRPYTLQDVLHIANEQAKLANEFEKKANTILFCDTSLLTIKIWLRVKYNYFNAEIEQLMMTEKQDSYLLTKPDIPWVDDNLREHPLFRNELFDMHMELLKKQGFNYEIISGDEILRVEQAKRIVNDLIENNSI